MRNPGEELTESWLARIYMIQQLIIYIYAMKMETIYIYIYKERA